MKIKNSYTSKEQQSNYIKGENIYKLYLRYSINIWTVYKTPKTQQPLVWVLLKKSQKIKSIGDDVEKLKLLCTTDGS